MDHPVTSLRTADRQVFCSVIMTTLTSVLGSGLENRALLDVWVGFGIVLDDMLRARFLAATDRSKKAQSQSMQFYICHYETESNILPRLPKGYL